MGKTDLGKWMITNGGEYSADATYEQLTMVKYGNSTYIILVEAGKASCLQ